MAKKKVDTDKDAKKKKLKKIETRLKSVDKELVMLEKELRSDSDSVVVDEDLEDLERRVYGMKTELIRRGGRDEKQFYRNFVLRCNSCKREFDHKADFEPIIRDLTCPGCEEDHIITITPTTKYFKIKFSKSIDVVDSEG